MNVCDCFQSVQTDVGHQQLQQLENGQQQREDISTSQNELHSLTEHVDSCDTATTPEVS